MDQVQIPCSYVKSLVGPRDSFLGVMSVEMAFAYQRIPLLMSDAIKESRARLGRFSGGDIWGKVFAVLSKHGFRPSGLMVDTEGPDDNPSSATISVRIRGQNYKLRFIVYHDQLASSITRNLPPNEIKTLNTDYLDEYAMSKYQSQQP